MDCFWLLLLCCAAFAVLLCARTLGPRCDDVPVHHLDCKRTEKDSLDPAVCVEWSGVECEGIIIIQDLRLWQSFLFMFSGKK